MLALQALDSMMASEYVVAIILPPLYFILFFYSNVFKELLGAGFPARYCGDI